MRYATRTRRVRLPPRTADLLYKQGKLKEYMQLLVDGFNPATVEGLMCRSLVSVAYDGSLYD